MVEHNGRTMVEQLSKIRHISSCYKTHLINKQRLLIGDY